MSSNADQHGAWLRKHSEYAVIALARELVEAGWRDEACELLKNSSLDDPAHREAYENELARIDGLPDLFKMFQQITVSEACRSSSPGPQRYSVEGPHTPMADSVKGIRLLSLPVRDGEEISCKLHTFDDPEDCLPYFALSYTWGDSEAPVRQIKLSGQYYQIRQNLFTFLWHIDNPHAAWREEYAEFPPEFGSFRLKNFLPPLPLDIQPAKWKYLWIDALCIDQSSDIEKTHQVQRMSEIFGRAAFVMVWLPTQPSDFPSNERERSMTGVGQHHELVRQARQKHWELYKKRTPDVLAFQAILKNPYWSRLWIVQEFALARNLLLCCGGWPVLWDDFRKDAMGGLFQVPKPRTFTALNEVRGETHIDYRTADEQLPELIRKLWASSCEDAQDRVFALLGLAGKGAKVSADYSMSTEELLLVMATAYPHYYKSDHKFYELASNLRLDDKTALQLFVQVYGVEALRSPALRRLAKSMGIVYQDVRGNTHVELSVGHRCS